MGRPYHTCLPLDRDVTTSQQSQRTHHTKLPTVRCVWGWGHVMSVSITKNTITAMHKHTTTTTTQQKVVCVCVCGGYREMREEREREERTLLFLFLFLSSFLFILMRVVVVGEVWQCHIQHIQPHNIPHVGTHHDRIHTALMMHNNVGN